MRLTKNFASGEFLVSDTHPGLLVGVKLTDEQLYKLYLLCVLGLQPIRDRFGRVKILSGFRTEALNTAIKGAKNSQHRLAEAADFVVPGRVMARVFDSLIDWKGQCFFYTKKGFIHLALPRLGVPCLHTTK